MAELRDILKSGDIKYINLNGSIRYGTTEPEDYGKNIVLGHNGFGILESSLRNKRYFVTTSNTDIPLNSSFQSLISYTTIEDIDKEDGAYNFIAFIDNPTSNVDTLTVKVEIAGILKKTFDDKIEAGEKRYIVINGSFENDIPNGTTIEISAFSTNGNCVVQGTQSNTTLVIIKTYDISLAREIDFKDKLPIILGNVVSNQPKINEIETALTNAGVTLPLKEKAIFLLRSNAKRFLIIYDGNKYLFEKLGVAHN